MRKSYWYGMILLAAIAFCGTVGDVEAQIHDPYGVVATGYHGIPAYAAPGNGAARHHNNGYYGVNYRHYARGPMRYGTGPTASQLRGYHPRHRYQGHRPGYVVYRPGFPPCRAGYPVAYPPQRHVQVGGAYYSNGIYIQGTVVIR